jgi:hypothetical protein
LFKKAMFFGKSFLGACAGVARKRTISAHIAEKAVGKFAAASHAKSRVLQTVVMVAGG